jgi:PIN domain nuclease of toxin-antitoxin system
VGHGEGRLIVLDTHVLLWLALEPEQVSEKAAAAIADEPDRAISIITAQEIAYLVARGRVDLNRPPRIWLADVLRTFDAYALSPTMAVAFRAGSLDPAEFHGDPIDRLIYATAVEHDAHLVTADRRLREVDPSRVVW